MDESQIGFWYTNQISGCVAARLIDIALEDYIMCSIVEEDIKYPGAYPYDYD